jgi:hypothetical protein
VVDFAAIRDELEKQVRQLVPLRATLGYSFGGVFDERAKQATYGIFAPAPGTRLDIRTEAKVEFLNPTKPTFNVIGELGRFDIKLVGDFLDAVTIKFHGARFTVKDGGKFDLQVFYDDFVVGEALEFVQQLQAFLSPQEGSGFFMRARFAPIGIEAGYSIALPIITMGTVSFSNVSLNASVIIPFDGTDTLFRAALSRVDAPFTISVAPFGGAGYFGIEANADGIIGFDAAFEFGGAIGFQFGPLIGFGRIMVGIYIRQTKVSINGVTRNLSEIMGTFYAGGVASIWIFNFGASLYVRLGQSGGNMVGEATFTFSFSAGIVDFDYMVKVQKKQDKMGGSAWLDGMAQDVQFAEISLKQSLSDAGGSSGPKPSKHFGEVYRQINAPCQSEDWATYNSYFEPIAGKKAYQP